MPMFWVLDEDNNHVGTDDAKLFSAFLENIENRLVAKTSVGNLRVSTVFLGMDHGFGMSTDPVLYETMCFGPDADEVEDLFDRYTTRELALEGHKRIVEKAKEIEQS